MNPLTFYLFIAKARVVHTAKCVFGINKQSSDSTTRGLLRFTETKKLILQNMYINKEQCLITWRLQINLKNDGLRNILCANYIKFRCVYSIFKTKMVLRKQNANSN